MHRMVLAILMLGARGLGAACNTVRGIGQDVERAGEKTQDAAESVRRRLKELTTGSLIVWEESECSVR